MDNEKALIGGEIPLGLSMALAQNTDAMKYFSQLPKQKQQNVIAKTKDIHSKKEMQSFVNEIHKMNFS
ncbi:MAG: hypothetical protein GX848_04025 [Clostridiales bacterium]|jgi:hypothetical protein|nr:hypothetical protein [Clostridiales bacterium]